MSNAVHSKSWVERNWYWLVISFGVLFVILLDSFAPTL
jgi:hypothetical protein